MFFALPEKTGLAHLAWSLSAHAPHWLTYQGLVGRWSAGLSPRALRHRPLTGRHLSPQRSVSP